MFGPSERPGARLAGNAPLGPAHSGPAALGPHAPPPPPHLDIPAGMPPNLSWEAVFLHALLAWAGALQWLPRAGQDAYIELALDFE